MEVTATRTTAMIKQLVTPLLGTINSHHLNKPHRNLQVAMVHLRHKVVDMVDPLNKEDMVDLNQIHMVVVVILAILACQEVVEELEVMEVSQDIY